MKITISFDMDGTINKMYDLPNWIEDINNGVVSPYINAKPAINFQKLAKILNNLQENGYQLQIITWLAKNGNEQYNQKVTKAKRQWLQKHLPSVVWDNIQVLEYGTPKQNYCYTSDDILFDDNKNVRKNWNGVAYDEKNILEILQNLLTNSKEYDII